MLRFIDGWDHYAIADIFGKWTTGLLTGTSSVQSGTVRTGAGALALTKSGSAQADTVTVGLGNNASTIIVGFGVRLSTTPTSPVVLCAIGDGSTDLSTQVALYLTTSGILQVYRSQTGNGMQLGQTSASGGVQLATASTALAVGQWNYVECKATIHNTAGAIELRVNGSSVGFIPPIGGVDTQFTGNASANVVGISGPYNQAGAVVYYDDLYLADDVAGDGVTTFLGPQKVATVIASSGNGTHTDFTPSTGTDHGALVDEATPNGDTDYNASSTVGHRDSYNFPALGVTGTVTAVQAVQWAKIDVAGARNVTGCTRIGGTTYDHPTPIAIDTTYRAVRSVWTKSPATSAFWSMPEIDAAEFGPVIQA